MSSFCLDGDCNAVHGAFTRGEPEQREDEHEVTFVSFCYHTSQMYPHETGMRSVDLSVLMRFHQLEKQA